MRPAYGSSAVPISLGYRAALEERTRERVPLHWAQTQNNLGNALATLGERKSGTARLEEAVQAYHEALQERTRQRVPLDWATTQSNLGNALMSLGQRESGTVRLEQAVAAYRAALEERTRERVPLEWAGSYGNQGVAMILIADRTNDPAVVETAVQQIETAYETLHSGGQERWAAYYEVRLPKAQAIRDRLNGKWGGGALSRWERAGVRGSTRQSKGNLSSCRIRARTESRSSPKGVRARPPD